MTFLSIITILIGYILVWTPAGWIIGQITKRWQNELPEDRDSLKDAGKIIGYLERFLTLTFIIFGQFSAIGFLLAAKSILRVGDKHSRKETEYILIGTLASFTAAIIIGIALHIVLDYFQLDLVDFWA